MSATAGRETRLSLFCPLIPATAPPGGPEAEDLPAAKAAWEAMLDRLRDLGGLPDDWDGQGAQAPAGGNVEAAVHRVSEMCRWRQALPPTQVSPGPTGEIVLAWRGDAFHLAAELSTPERIEWLLNLPGEPLRQWETDAHRPWIVRAGW